MGHGVRLSPALDACLGRGSRRRAGCGTAVRTLPCGGFTLVELLLVLVMATLVVISLQQAVFSQQRFLRQSRSLLERHDALRTVAAVLSHDLREAIVSDGDVTVLSPDSLQIRSPVGFAVACAVDESRQRLALAGLSGRIDRTVGDSLMIYHPTGWIVTAVRRVNPGGATMNCPYAGGSTPDVTIQVFGSIAGVPAGAPVRAFRPYDYHLEAADGAVWFARTDVAGTEILAGPLASDGTGFLVELLDSLGQVTAIPASAARVRITAVADADEARRGTDPIRRDTITVTVGARN
jgi:type II secretory pathway pseudopilin PulG